MPIASTQAAATAVGTIHAVLFGSAVGFATGSGSTRPSSGRISIL